MERGGSEDTPGSFQGRVIVVGAASRDIALDDPRGWRLGGAATYAALMLAHLGFGVGAVIGLDAAAADAAELALLRAAGVDLAPVALERGPVFENLELPGGRAQRCLQVSDPIPPSALPHAWRDEVRAWFLGPVASEIPDQWTEVVGGGRRDPDGADRDVSFPGVVPVALGWQGLLRDLAVGAGVTRRPPGSSALLDVATLIGVGRDDLDPAVPLERLTPVIPDLATLVITDGAAGGVVSDAAGVGGRRRVRRYRAIRTDRVIDPTGAGDVFLAAMFAARLDPQRFGGRPGPAAGMRLAAAAASLVIEGKGLEGVPDLAAVLRRAARRSASA
jgi:hypothetical protein